MVLKYKRQSHKDFEERERTILTIITDVVSVEGYPEVELKLYRIESEPKPGEYGNKEFLGFVSEDHFNRGSRGSSDRVRDEAAHWALRLKFGWDHPAVLAVSEYRSQVMDERADRSVEGQWTAFRHRTGRMSQGFHWRRRTWEEYPTWRYIYVTKVDDRITLGTIAEVKGQWVIDPDPVLFPDESPQKVQNKAFAARTLAQLAKTQVAAVIEDLKDEPKVSSK